MPYLDRLPLLDQQTNPHLLVVGDRASAGRVLASRFAQAADLVYLTAHDESRGQTVRSLSGRSLSLIDALTGTREGTSRLRELLMAQAGAGAADVGKVLDRLYMIPSTRSVVGDTRGSVMMLAVKYWSAATVADAIAVITDVVQNAEDHRLPHPLASVNRSQGLIDAREVKLDIEAGRIPVSAVTLFIPVREPADWMPYRNSGMEPSLSVAERDQVRHLAELDLRAQKPTLAQDAIAEVVEARLDDHLWAWSFEHAIPASRRAGVVGSRDLITALRDDPLTEQFAKVAEATLSGLTMTPRWWTDQGVWIIATESCTDLRRAVILESLLEAAAGPEVIANPKAVIIEDDAYLTGPLAKRALTNALRGGRKHNLFVILVTNTEPVMEIAALMGTWVVSHAQRQVLGKVPSIPAGDPEPVAWLLSARAPQPQPLSAWYTQHEVIHGERVVTGAIIDPVPQESDHV